MSFQIDEIKSDYLRKILDASLNNRDYSTIVFRASFCLDEVKSMIEELKREYHIDNVIIIDFDNDKLKSFYGSNPTEDEIKRFIPKFSKPIGNVKLIHFINDQTDYSENYHSYCSKKYRKHLNEYNKEVFDVIKNLSKSDMTITVYPNKKWAESIFENQEDSLKKLWVKISEILLSSDLARNEIEESLERKRKLNEMGIRNLFFYTDLGTDFRISLNSHSVWACEPENIDGVLNFFNYPSYEVFTSPNCYSAEGKIVLSNKRRFFYDILVENAIFEFSKGRLIGSESNSEMFDSIVLNKANRMNRIGEVALVSHFSPLAKLGEFYDSILLDENTGCHIALGSSIDECIGVEKDKLEKNGARYYRYNTSKFHTDFVFGNDSISVEAETRGKKKVLLMEKGNWKI